MYSAVATWLHIRNQSRSFRLRKQIYELGTEKEEYTTYFQVTEKKHNQLFRLRSKAYVLGS
jgi:hypothetical protein